MMMVHFHFHYHFHIHIIHSHHPNQITPLFQLYHQYRTVDSFITLLHSIITYQFLTPPSSSSSTSSASSSSSSTSSSSSSTLLLEYAKTLTQANQPALYGELRDLVLVALHYQYSTVLSHILSHFAQIGPLPQFLELVLLVITVVARDDVSSRVRSTSLASFFAWVSTVSTNWRMQVESMEFLQVFGINEVNV